MSTTETTLADRRFYVFSGILSLLIVGFLGWLLLLREPAPGGEIDVSFLPAVNASLNSLASLFLISGFIAIRNKRRDIHKYLMISALAASSLFLISYVIYHAIHGDTKYPGEGTLRVVYLAILASHVLLSMILPFLALTVVWFAFCGNFAKHRRIARITLPIWLYVSVTGVIIFAMLRAAMG